MVAAVLAGCKNRNKETKQAEVQVETAKEAAVAPDTHNSRNSLNYEGVYRGVLPCADCSGIETTITLDRSGNYTRTMKYLGKAGDATYTDSGKYKWDETGNKIELDSESAVGKYQVGEGRLFQLDLEGNRITGDLAEHYILIKE